MTDEEAEQLNKNFDKIRYYNDKKGKKKYYIKKDG